VVLNVAGTLFELFAMGGNVHASAVPVHAPAQFAKTLPAAGVAERVTDVPTGNDVRHTVPQVMPAGLDVTVPDPEPALATVADGAAVTVNGNDTEDESFPSIPRIKRLYGPVPAVNATRMLSVLDAELLASAGELSVTVTLSGTATTDSDTVPLACQRSTMSP
jgi:hypothetical protein